MKTRKQMRMKVIDAMSLIAFLVVQIMILPGEVRAVDSTSPVDSATDSSGSTPTVPATGSTSYDPTDLASVTKLADSIAVGTTISVGGKSYTYDSATSKAGLIDFLSGGGATSSPSGSSTGSTSGSTSSSASSGSTTGSSTGTTGSTSSSPVTAPATGTSGSSGSKVVEAGKTGSTTAGSSTGVVSTLGSSTVKTTDPRPSGYGFDFGPYNAWEAAARDSYAKNRKKDIQNEAQAAYRAMAKRADPTGNSRTQAQAKQRAIAQQAAARIMAKRALSQRSK